MCQTNVKKRLSYLALATVLCGFVFIQFQLAKTDQFPPLKISAQNSALNINHQLINTLHLGQRRMIASVVWIETLLNSDIEHYRNDDLNSWMYLRFNALIELDPKFYAVYRYGGQYLSIVKDDKIGAEDIYRRGLEVFPNDFWLNFHAGFHYYFEMDQAENAIKRFRKIVNDKNIKRYAPYLPSLISKLRLKQHGSSLELISMIEDLMNQHEKNGPIWMRLNHTLYIARCQFDLSCLNTGAKNCNTHDLDHNPYYFDESLAQYRALKDCDAIKKSPSN